MSRKSNSNIANSDNTRCHLGPTPGRVFALSFLAPRASRLDRASADLQSLLAGPLTDRTLTKHFSFLRPSFPRRWNAVGPAGTHYFARAKGTFTMPAVNMTYALKLRSAGVALLVLLIASLGVRPTAAAASGTNDPEDPKPMAGSGGSDGADQNATST